jgi:hypothetical protein
MARRSGATCCGISTTLLAVLLAVLLAGCADLRGGDIGGARDGGPAAAGDGGAVTPTADAGASDQALPSEPAADGPGAPSDAAPDATPDGRPDAAPDAGPPPPVGDLFRNPFNKLSAHHRPVGAGAEAGVPGGTLTPSAVSPTHDPPGTLDARGRLANVKLFRCGTAALGRKYIHRVTATDPWRTVGDLPDAPADNKLPATLRMPTGVPYPSTGGDDEVLVWPRNGGAADQADLFFNFEDDTSHARRRYEYSLGGTDVHDGVDGQDRGCSASGLRYPGTVLRGFEINPPAPGPIHHALHVTATRHSRAGAPGSAHVLGKTMVWPAYHRDSSAGDADENLGDLPYGTRIFIRWQDRGLRDTLGLSARGQVLFDALLYHGIYIVDGQGEHHDGGGVLQLRIDHAVGKNADGSEWPGVVEDVNAQLMKLLPHLYPMRNPRPHDVETELHSDGLPYAGGGGPRPADLASGAGSYNTAWDAP